MPEEVSYQKFQFHQVEWGKKMSKKAMREKNLITGKGVKAYAGAWNTMLKNNRKEEIIRKSVCPKLLTLLRTLLELMTLKLFRTGFQKSTMEDTEISLISVFKSDTTKLFCKHTGCVGAPSLYLRFRRVCLGIFHCR